MLIVVESDVRVLFPIQSILKDAGFRVLSASSGDKAIKLAGAFPEPIDLLLSSLYMPGINGIELRSSLRISRPKIKSLFMQTFSGGDLLLLFEKRWILVSKSDAPAMLIESVDDTLDTDESG